MFYRYSGEKVMNLAAIDIGTNSCRLLVSRVSINLQRKSHLRINQNPIQWRSIDSFCRVVKLGENLTKTGKISQQAIERTLDTLHVIYKKICYYRVSHLQVVATEACRRATNSYELQEKVRSRFNMAIDIISGKQEAEYALLGCSEILNWKKPYTLIFDIGGGSTEIMWVKLNLSSKVNYLLTPFYEVLDSISLPYGVVTVNDNLEGYASKEEIFKYVSEKVLKDLKIFAEKNKIKELSEEFGAQMIGSSGTVTAFATLFLGLENYDRRKIDGLRVPVESISSICQSINKYDEEEMQNMNLCRKMENINLCRKSEMMNVGAGILQGIFDAIPIKELTVADRGVREGIIVNLIRQKIGVNFEAVESVNNIASV